MYKKAIRILTMKNIIKNIIDTIIDLGSRLPIIGKFIDRNLVLYGLIGITGVVVDFLIFTLLVRVIGLYYVISNIISVSFGLVNNFYLNRRFNFKVYNKPVHRFLSFYLIGFIGIWISTLLIYVFVEFLGIPILLTKIMAVVVVVILQYIANRYITFR